MADALPEHGWRVRGDVVFPEKRVHGVQLRLRWVWKFIPFAIRYALWFVYMKIRRRAIFINNFSMLKAKHIYGVPLGGMGSGSIGRSFLGDFVRRQISPASLYDFRSNLCDNFILAVEDPGRRTSDASESSAPLMSAAEAATTTTTTMTTRRKVTTLAGRREPDVLGRWKCEVSPSDVDYVGLFPRSWIRYSLEEFGVVLTCRQVSPVVPHDYQDSCLPVGVFVWDVEYSGDKERFEGSLTFSWTGDGRAGCAQRTFEKPLSDGSVVRGLLFEALEPTETSYAIALKRKKTSGDASGDSAEFAVSFLRGFDEKGDGALLWSSLAGKGVLPCSWGEEGKTEDGRGGAVCVSFVLGKDCRRQRIEMALSWGNPEVKFPTAKRTHRRRYTRWFQSPDQIAAHALENYPVWEAKIEAWQTPILQDASLPDWYKSAIFNELYYFVDGGAVWLDADEEMAQELSDMDPRKKFGRFLYLESHEYIMYSTVDVHFYSAATFADLWPKIELSIQLDVAGATVQEDNSVVWTHSSGRVHRKYKNCVPHDVGCPGEDPWVKVNAYVSHNTAEWKDLNLKFVLESYRDYGSCFKDGVEGEQTWFLKEVWPVCLAVMKKAEKRWDKDGDGMIENDPSHPDQTYDMWFMDGPSAYCGILWVCSVYSMWKMAGLVGDTAARKSYGELMKKAVAVLDEKLWNGSYYRFDSSRGEHREVIFADQLCGLWSLLLGLNPSESVDTIETALNPVMNKERIKSILKTIYENNVRKSMGGKMGAVNGYSPTEHRPDTSAAQAEETWTGVNYALASTMLFYGMEKEAFETAEGVYRTVYERSGLAFETPEALTAAKYYRAPGYMRPLCIWSMQLALGRRRLAESGM